MIISISGPRGGGKDTVGKIIQYLFAKKAAIEDTSMPNREYWINISFEEYLSHKMFFTNWKIKKFATKLKQAASLLTGIPVEDFEKEEVKNSYLPECWNKWLLFDDRSDLYIGLAKNKDEAFYRAENDCHLYTEFTSITVRQFLQWLGTDAIRDNLHENTWVNALMSEYKPTHIISKVDKYFGKGILLRKKGKSYIYKSYHWKDLNIIQDGYIDEQGEHSVCHYPEEHDLVFPNWIITDSRFHNELQAIKDNGGICIRVNKQIVESDMHESENSWRSWQFDYVISNNGTIEDLIVQVKQMLKHFNFI